MSGPHDLLICFDHASAIQVKRLTAALAAGGVSCHTSECSNSSDLDARLATSKALLIWASEEFFRSRSGQTQLAMALIAEGREPQFSTDRVMAINALNGLKHIYPLFLRDRIIGLSPELPEAPDFDALAAIIRERCNKLDNTLGGLYPTTPIGWQEPYDRLTHPPDHFCGRERELWDIHSTLAPQNDSAPCRYSGHGPVVIVSGSAGQGKSCLAREYAFRFGSAYPGGIFRISAREALPAPSVKALASNPALKPQLLALIHKLDPTSGLGDATPLVIVRRHIADLLENRNQPCLWIVDDIPDGLNGPALLQWLAPSPYGRTLALSRSQRYHGRADAIHMPTLDTPTGLNLLTRNISTNQDEREAAVWLMDELGRHPRLTAIAAALTETRRRNRRTVFLNLLNQSHKKNRQAAELVEDLPGEFPPGHENIAAGLLLDAVHALPTPARNIIFLATQLGHDALPIQFLADCFVLSGLSADDHEQDLFTVFLNDPADAPMNAESARRYVEEGAAALVRFALASRTDNSLVIYPATVLALARFTKNADKQTTLREAALQRIYITAESCAASNDWGPLHVLAAHGRTLVGDLKERLIEQDDTASEITGRIRLTLYLADMDLNHGARSRAFQLYRAASTYLVRAMAADPHNSSRHRDFAKVQEHLGGMVAEDGDVGAALEHYRKSLGVRTFMSKSDPGEASLQLDLLRLNLKIGEILTFSNDPEDALHSYLAAHQIHTRLAQGSPEDEALQFDLASSHKQLAQTYIRLNRPGSAMTALEEALPIFEALAEKHPETLNYIKAPGSIHTMVGNLLRARDDLTGALNRYRMALTIAENATLLDPSQADTQRQLALCHDSMGDTLTGLDDSTEAETHYLACLTIAENPAAHPAFTGIRKRDISVVQIKLGMARETARDYEAALSRYLDARGMIERLAVELPDNKSLRDDLAWLRNKIDRLVERRDSDLRRQARQHSEQHTQG